MSESYRTVLENLIEVDEKLKKNPEDKQFQGSIRGLRMQAMSEVQNIIHDIASIEQRLQSSNLTDAEKSDNTLQIRMYIEYLKNLELILKQSPSDHLSSEYTEITHNTLKVAEALYDKLDSTVVSMLVESIASDFHQISMGGRSGAPDSFDVKCFDDASKNCEKLYLHILDQLRLEKPMSEGSMDEVLPKIVDILKNIAVQSDAKFGLNDGKWIGDLCYNPIITEKVQGQPKFAAILLSSAIQYMVSESPELLSKEAIHYIKKDSVDLGDFKAELDRVSNNFESIMSGARKRSHVLLNAWRGVRLNEEERQELQNLRNDLEQLKSGEYKNLFNKKIGVDLAKVGCEKYIENIRALEDKIDLGLGKSPKTTRAAGEELPPSTPKRRP